MNATEVKTRNGKRESAAASKLATTQARGAGHAHSGQQAKSETSAKERSSPEMIAAIRIRGVANVEPRIKLGLSSLKLLHPNNMVLLPATNQSARMVQKVKDYVTFGEIDERTLAAVFENRLETLGGHRVTEENLRDLKVTGFEELAKQVFAGKISLGELGLSNVCRLHPPRKGHRRKGVKTPFSSGGALGNRGKVINELILRMI